MISLQVYTILQYTVQCINISATARTMYYTVHVHCYLYVVILTANMCKMLRKLGLALLLTENY